MPAMGGVDGQAYRSTAAERAERLGIEEALECLNQVYIWRCLIVDLYTYNYVYMYIYISYVCVYMYISISIYWLVAYLPLGKV